MPVIGALAAASSSGWGGRGASPIGGSVAFASLRDFGIAAVTGPAGVPTAGGTLSINGQSLGSYDYRIVRGPTTVSAFTATDWFTTTEDTRSACIFVDGDLTINAGQTFTPTVRKLFTFLYVKGNFNLSGTLSMSARGANHSGTGNSGGATTAAAIRIANGTYSAVVDPQVPAAGGAGGSGAGTAGGTGGGGNGSTTNGVGGAGRAGTSFTGGSGGGGANNGLTGGSGIINGGAGGAAASTGSYTGGGAGNPGGAGAGAGGGAGLNGTGGVLVVICTGTFSGAGGAQANGVRGGNSSGASGTDGHGGGTGGGSVTIMFGTDTSTITPTATGGAGGTGSGPSGGAGGNGTARKLQLT